MVVSDKGAGETINSFASNFLLPNWRTGTDSRVLFYAGG